MAVLRFEKNILPFLSDHGSSVETLGGDAGGFAHPRMGAMLAT
jgi:hypothetical protein